MGADMHTAQPFSRRRPAGRGAVVPDGAPLLMPMRAPAAGEPRVTLTAPVLRAAIRIHVLITGPKSARPGAGAGLPPEEAPVRIVLDQATVHWAE
jgi:6-phosphogluconolactonase